MSAYAGIRILGGRGSGVVLICGLAAWLALVGQVLAQTGGTITFANNSSSLVTNAQTGSAVTTNDGIKAALYWAPVGSNTLTQIPGLVTVGVPLAGLFAGGTRTTDPSAPGGNTNQFQVRAWAGGYATYEQAAQHPGVLIGQSAVLVLRTGNPVGQPPTPPNSLLGLVSFQLKPATNVPSQLILTCASNKTVQCGAAWSFDQPGVMDTCTNTNVTLVALTPITNGACPQLITQTWVATDTCGNSNNCSQTVTIVDTNPPAIACGTNKTVQCGSVWSFDAPTASDLCTTNVTIMTLGTIMNGTCPQVITRTWVATDACGNTNTCSQTVTVVDTISPTISCGANKTVQCGSVWNFDVPTASDTCSTNATIAVWGTITNGTCPQVITRAWVATDPCGNTNICSQTVTIVDTNSPAITCSTNKTVQCGSLWNFDDPTASDACSTNVTIAAISTITNGQCPQVITRTWSASDGCGNSNTCSQVVTLTCSNCQVIVVTKNCPPHPVPPGGVLTFTGTVTNAGYLTLSNVLVVDDQPTPNTVVFGPAILPPGAGSAFTGSYSVPACNCGPFTDRLLVTGKGADGILYSNSIAATCPGTNYAVPGDLNGDGIVDQNELNAVLANYWAHSPWVYMSNAVALGNGVFQFELTNSTGWNFTVLASTNLADWTNLPDPAYPVYQFRDPAAASNAPVRLYRLRYP